MRMKDKLIGAGAMLIALGGVGSVAAMAQTSGASTPPPASAPASPTAQTPEPVSPTDTDTLQEGDQNTPDVPGAKETPDPNEKADSAKESATDTDGPGGHQDPPGQVDNQQGAKN